MVESTTHDMVPDLLDGRIDVALVRLPLIEPAALELTVIERDELVAAVPTESGHVQRGRIDLADLADEPFISLGPTSILRTTVLMACHEAGFVPRMTQEVPQLSTVLCLVQSGLGVALVPSNVKLNTPRGVRLLPLKRSPTIEIGLALAPGLATPAASNFKKLALSKLQDTSKAGGLVNPDKDQLPLKTGGRRSKKAATASS
jgi:DNA-binding transcriptional LysR family regulator